MSDKGAAWHRGYKEAQRAGIGAPMVNPFSGGSAGDNYLVKRYAEGWNASQKHMALVAKRKKGAANRRVLL